MCCSAGMVWGLLPVRSDGLTEYFLVLVWIRGQALDVGVWVWPWCLSAGMCSWYWRLVGDRKVAAARCRSVRWPVWLLLLVGLQLSCWHFGLWCFCGSVFHSAGWFQNSRMCVSMLEAKLQSH